MTTLAQKVSELGYALPKSAAPAANYVPSIVNGKQLYISGQIPLIDGKPHHLARLGDDYTVEQGQEAARVCALNILALLNEVIEGDLKRLDCCIKLGGFVQCVPDFTAQSAVINGASDLMVDVLGYKGRHTRFAVGVAALPLGVAVEVDALFALK